VPDPVVAVVYMNWGKWVADCPRPFCLNAEQFGRCDDGTIGGLGGELFHCRDDTRHGGCGLTCPAQWPANVEDLEAVILARPVPGTRNWRPGETLDDLIHENAAHGLVPAAALTTRTPTLLTARDQLVVPGLGWANRLELEG
jgi:hypothetical protein